MGLVTTRPNTRVQRTRVARFARPGSPLTRHPLGALKRQSALGIAALLLAAGVVTGDSPLPRPSRFTVCSPNKAFCATADPATQTISIGAQGTDTAIWSLKPWHRLIFIANDGEHLMIGPEGLNLVPLDTKLPDPLLVFMKRKAVVRVVTVGDLYP